MKSCCIEYQILSLLSLFWPLILSGSQFLAPVKNHQFLRFIHLIYIIILLVRPYVRTLASYPGPFTCAVHAGREIRAWYQSFAHA